MMRFNAHDPDTIPLAAIGCGSAGCGGRHATILAQIIKLGQKLTDGAAVTMFI
ncbi:hypothetical protein NKY68_25115 [Sinorhizobium meliloti]|uniref:hypothetical protein n=2 Tax=Rhizobium meliloti TaxID=382 RepID=UPI000308CE2A|nr:hypothetical protein [Sinorhizobium meliloti]